LESVTDLMSLKLSEWVATESVTDKLWLY